MSQGLPPPGALQPPKGPPYLPAIAQLGGVPVPHIDDPICAVLLVFFVTGAALNMTIFQINRRRDHKFIMSALLFGFCMARIAALVMRIVWASRSSNVSISIAANIFIAAGVIIIFVINIIFTQRLVRAYHPNFGWKPIPTAGFRFLLFSVIGVLIMVIVATVLSFFTLNPSVRDHCRKVQLFASTYLAVMAFLPIPILLAAWAAPRRDKIDKFGQGRFRTKLILVLFTASLLTLGAGFRAGINYNVRPISNPAPYHSKAAFYCMNFVIELIVMYTYTLMRFDRRFHIPNGSSGPGEYSRESANKLERRTSLLERVTSEAEAYGGDGTRPTHSGSTEAEADAWDKEAKRELEKEARGEPGQV